MKRVTFIAGHYGSGKTNVAVNLAIKKAKENEKIKIADLDIVNPYFRTKDSKEILSKYNIELIVSDFANSNLDIPSLPQQMYSVADEKDFNFIVDVGGDERGALALGRLHSRVGEDEYDMFVTVNFYRPLSSEVEDIIKIMEEIEFASRFHFTGIINNSNIGSATDEKDILNSVKKAEELSKRTNLPIVMTSVREDLYDSLKDRINNLFPLKLQTTI